MLKYHWKRLPKAKKEQIEQLSSVLNHLSPELTNVLIQREINSFDKAKAYFRPDLNTLHNPFLMKDMEKAVQRILEAEANNEQVLIYGDYDVDGTTAVSLMLSFFKRLSVGVSFYIPDRYNEGYGISTAGIDYAHEQGIDLIIALDCGIKARAQVERANSYGIDTIICDHHLPGKQLPAAHAVLDPKRQDCLYPFKELSGCGIGFKLCQAIALKKDLPVAFVYEHLDLVAISIACDIVPIVGENRTLCAFGLDAINESPRPGIKALLGEEPPKRRIQVSDLVFRVGPRINAAGRIEHGKFAVDLITSDPETVQQKAEVINENNTTRRALDQDITRAALEGLQKDPEAAERFSTVVFDPSWHKGVIGIVASRLIEHYYRPTVVLTEYEGVVSGSVRSVEGFDVYQALEACSEHLIQFGGHAHAAGLTMQSAQIASFRKAFEQAVKSTIKDDCRVPTLLIDGQFRLSELTPRLYKVIQRMAPFGPGNTSPLFVSYPVRDTKGWSRAVGTDGAHLKLHLDQEECSMGGIAFNFGHLEERVKAEASFAVVYHLELNEWKGKTTLQLMVKDIKFKDELPQWCH